MAKNEAYSFGHLLLIYALRKAFDDKLVLFKRIDVNLRPKSHKCISEPSDTSLWFSFKVVL